MACLFAILLVYSQTAAFAWDEGYHVLAAQSIAHGRRPYLDFFFPQTPLNAYWNAAAMRIFGESWHEVHALSSVVMAGTIALAAAFLYSGFPVPGWRLPCALSAALLIGLQPNTIEYGTTGQPYALSVLLTVAAFRTAVWAVEREDWMATSLTGCLASGGTACSLLVAPAPVVVLLWTLRHSEQRLRKLLAFVAGALVPYLPVLWLFAHRPRQVFFNVFEYHLVHRRQAFYENATAHDWKVLTSWVGSPGVWVLVLLAAAGLWHFKTRPEFRLCAWLGLTIGVEVCLAHPTFEWYFILPIPFFAILAAAGLYAVSARLAPRLRPGWAAASLLAILGLGAGKALWNDRGDLNWYDLEPVARKVEEVTPRGAPLWADEVTYFLTGRTPAEGTECAYAEVINLPPSLARSLHIVSLDELDRQAAAGGFRTVSTCETPSNIEEMGLPRDFRHSAEVSICHVFWEPLATGGRTR